MLRYPDLGPDVEAFSTNCADPVPTAFTPELQAHGTRVAVAPCEPALTHDVDAIITRQRGLRIGVRTADCVPVLVHDPVRHAVAAIHSGWKGTAANIVGAAIDAMASHFGTRAADCRAVIAPCIHVEAFEVGADVMQIFADAGYTRHCRMLPHPADPSRIRWHIDLPAICAEQLASLGVTQVTTRPECTYASPDLYSYRRQGAELGQRRIYNCIMLSPTEQQ